MLQAINRIKPLLLNKNNALKIISTKFSISFTDQDATIATKKPKKIFIPRITLIASENVSVTTVEEAQKLAKRRDLKLVKILDLDTKTQRPIYKLMTGSEYHAEDLKQREERKKERLNSTSIKGEKVVILGSNITEHDLMTYVNKIIKWINKRFEVRVVINGDSANMDKAEHIYSFIESKTKEVGKILQKRQKGNDIKYQITPIKKDNDKDKQL